jgi:hypothetical protein
MGLIVLTDLDQCVAGEGACRAKPAASNPVTNFAPPLLVETAIPARSAGVAANTLYDKYKKAMRIAAHRLQKRQRRLLAEHAALMP